MWPVGVDLVPHLYPLPAFGSQVEIVEVVSRCRRGLPLRNADFESNCVSTVADEFDVALSRGEFHRVGSSEEF